MSECALLCPACGFSLSSQDPFCARCGMPRCISCGTDEAPEVPKTEEKGDDDD